MNMMQNLKTIFPEDIFGMKILNTTDLKKFIDKNEIKRDSNCPYMFNLLKISHNFRKLLTLKDLQYDNYILYYA